MGSNGMDTNSTNSKTFEFLERYPVTDIDGNIVTKKTAKTARVPRENEIVMTSLHPKKRTFFVPKRKINEFCRCVYWDIVNRREFYVTESIPRDNNPFRLDIDMKAIFAAKNSEYKKRRRKDIKRIIIRIYDYFCDFMLEKFKIEPKNLVCYAMAKRDMREDLTNNDGVKYVDGVHLLFPHVRQSSLCLRKITDMVKYIASKDNNIFQGTLSSQSCIDNIETKNWTIYGSSKEGLAYVSTHTLYRTKNNVTKVIASISESEETIRRFLMTPNDIEPVEPRKEFRETMEEEKHHLEEIRKERIARMNSVEFSEAELSKASDLLHMLDPRRFENYDDWRNIGFMIHNISNGHEEGLELWKEMSEKMDPIGYNKAGTQQKMLDLWDYATRKSMSGEVGGYTMGSLIFFAQQDNPEQYDNWRRNIYHSDIDMAITKLSQGRICALAKTLYGREFVYTKEDNWFQFTKVIGHWKKDHFKQPHFMFNMFNVRMKKELNDYINKGNRTDLHKFSDKIEEKFEHGPFLEGLTRFAQKKFSDDEEFEQKLDQGKWLVGTQNGVYDLKNGIHRVGLPEDYVSMKMGAAYRDYTWDHPEVKSVMRYWAKLHVDPKLRHWFLKAISVIMVAGNLEKMIIVMTNNDGNAGKSKALDFIRWIFGDYSQALKRERFVISTMKSAGGADQDVVNMKNRRLGFVTEISSEETLDIGALKAPSDTIQARGLYEKGGEMTPLYTMIIMLNKLPPIPGNDKPTFNRLRIVPHESIFDDEAPTDPGDQWKKKHFKPDKNIDQRLQKLKDAGLWIFLQYFKIYQQEGLDPIPAKVMQATKQYRQNNDVFEQFIKSHLVEDLKNKKAMVKVDDAFYKEYAMFHQMATKGSGLRPVKPHDFRMDIISYFGSKKTEISRTAKGVPKFFEYIDTSKKFPILRGYRLKEDDDESEEGLESEEEEVGSDDIDWDAEVEEEEEFDHVDYEKYFIGPTFIGIEDDDNSILFSD